MVVISRSIRPDAFCKKGVLKNFTGKQQCQSLYFNKVAPATKIGTLAQVILDIFFMYARFFKNLKCYQCCQY